MNVGLYRSGTTTLAEAASELGYKVYRRFPDLTSNQLKRILQNPTEAVQEWWSSEEGGISEFIDLTSKYHFICDGWIALLPFLPISALKELDQEARKSNIHLRFVATSRNIEETVKSELQHWVIHDLERQADLNPDDRAKLEQSLRERARQHKELVQGISSTGKITILPLEIKISDTWSTKLSALSDFTADDWSKALQKVGVCNANPSLPIEGILLTMRFESGQAAVDKIRSVTKLLNQIEQDSLCRYLVVLGIDADERSSDAALKLIHQLESRVTLKGQMLSLHVVSNPSVSPGQPFAICAAWDAMAVEAWSHGAGWVVLLGDDVEVECSYHYRAFYRSFQDISTRLGVPFGFGAPFWNDRSFPGFPSFPCVGKAHFEIFGSLIPSHRKGNFVNQDLDPYIHHLYLKIGAAPCATEAVLFNGHGGHIGSSNARYERVFSKGWRDFVLEDYRDHVRPYFPKVVEEYLPYVPKVVEEYILLDVIVPSYRVRLDYLSSICSLKVPKRIHSNFIIIVDNKEALLRAANEIQELNGLHRADPAMKLSQAERVLEEFLSKTGNNNVRVRCNEENLGASASRNRGLDESVAEFVLNLDDDLVPDEDLLMQYGNKLFEIVDDPTVVGLVGLVRFPRKDDLPLHHAAVLMSYLTFMFEIAERDLYANPAWGVTANILFRRTKIRFDLAYAKTGGGEDVDFAIRVTEELNGGKLLAVPEARVVHPFWPGSVFTLFGHFHSWAIGDGSLFKRFPEHCYWSFPNLPEIGLLALPFCYWIGIWKYIQFILWSILVDFAVDAVHLQEYKHRCDVVQGMGNDRAHARRSHVFYFVAHFLANLYVLWLEWGRLRGHVIRLDVVYGMYRRFDWHIGRLPNSRSNFRKREGWKFGLFLSILAFQVMNSVRYN